MPTTNITSQPSNPDLERKRQTSPRPARNLTLFLSTSCTNSVLKQRGAPSHKYPNGTPCKLEMKKNRQACLAVEEKIESLLLKEPIIQLHYYKATETQTLNIYEVKQTRAGLKIEPFYCKKNKCHPLNAVICSCPKPSSKQIQKHKSKAFTKEPGHAYYQKEVQEIDKIHRQILKKDQQIINLFPKRVLPRIKSKQIFALMAPPSL